MFVCWYFLPQISSKKLSRHRDGLAYFSMRGRQTRGCGNKKTNRQSSLRNTIAPRKNRRLSKSVNVNRIMGEVRERSNDFLAELCVPKGNGKPHLACRLMHTMALRILYSLVHRADTR